MRQSAWLLRQQIESNSTATDALLGSSFALTNEALRRARGMEFYDVQLAAGRTLALGNVAEMQTGEGKTIVAALPAAFHAMSGRGVHIATTNEYLGQRDFEIVGPILKLLGISTGLLPAAHNEAAARAAYLCDVTYGTGHQFGFDYLRDQLQLRNRPRPSVGTMVLQRVLGMDDEQRLLQRPPAYAIIDEIDSVLLDEANTPLILSGPANSVEDPEAYKLARDIASTLCETSHYQHDVTRASVTLTQAGNDLAMDCLQGCGLRSLTRPWLTYIQNALHAGIILRRDVDYVLQAGEVQIVDCETGRIAPDRNWSDGLHQAVEAKEGATITPPNQSNARVTRQRYFRRYPMLCGMTGTATGSESEFRKVYRMTIEKIPLNRPNRRSCEPNRYFATLDAKESAVVKDIQQRQDAGQPVLVGTKTIEASKSLSKRLHAVGVEHVVLNGVQDNTEAEIIANAGRLGAVTIATNMAGRGTDIALDDRVLQAGGLHVLATEHHESSRVDRQLVGRSARQGAVGSCQFMVSAEDDIIAKHAPQLALDMIASADATGECKRCYETSIHQLQERLQRKRFQQRKQMMEQDDWKDIMLTGFLG